MTDREAILKLIAILLDDTPERPALALLEDLGQELFDEDV